MKHLLIFPFLVQNNLIIRNIYILYYSLFIATNIQEMCENPPSELQVKCCEQVVSMQIMGTRLFRSFLQDACKSSSFILGAKVSHSELWN